MSIEKDISQISKEMSSMSLSISKCKSNLEEISNFKDTIIEKYDLMKMEETSYNKSLSWVYSPELLKANSMKKEASISSMCSHGSYASYIYSLPRPTQDTYLMAISEIESSSNSACSLSSKLFKVRSSSFYKEMDEKITHLLTLFNHWEDVSMFFEDDKKEVAHGRFLILCAKRVEQPDGLQPKMQGYINILKTQIQLLKDCLKYIDSSKHND